MPRHIASRVVSTRRFASTDGVPTKYMRLVSPCQPSLITVTSMLTMSPSFSTLASLGMPWQITLLTEVQIGRREAPVADVGRDRLLHVDDVVVADAVELVGGDAGLHVRRDHVQHLGGQAAGHAHLLDLFGGFDGDGFMGTRMYGSAAQAREGRQAPPTPQGLPR